MKIGKNGKKAGGFLSRLRGDESGNIIAMTAAAVLPMIAVVGGAVDMSRIYMTKARLQAACDAGTLAGRKAMPATTYTTAAKARADAMFAFNYKASEYQATGTTFLSSANAQGALTGTASTTLPTVLMKIFGKTTTNLTVTCGADLQVPNIDIVMVLDVTGSMNETINGTKKIDSLKSSVKSFYTTIANLLPVGSTSQIRYGFVPYSQAVNGSGLFRVSPDSTKGELPLSHIVDTMSLPTRVANFNTVVPAGWVVDSDVSPTTIGQTYTHSNSANREPFVASNATGTPMSFNDCNNYSANLSFNIGLGNPTAPGDVKIYPNHNGTFPGEGGGTSEFYQAAGSSTWDTAEPTTGSSHRKMTFSKISGPTVNSGGSVFADFDACRRLVTITTFKRRAGFKFTNWTYKNVNFGVSQFKQGTAINYVSGIDSNYTVLTPGSYNMVQLRQLPNQSGVTSSSTTWNGCLEERDTTAVASFTPIPAAAKDLNYLDGGTDDTFRWRPVLQQLAWVRNGPPEETTTDGKYQPGHACPAAQMRNLQVMTQAQVNTYVDTLAPDGYTYLDVGLVWGLRMISPQGIFASRNAVGTNGGQIQRYVIFMTDGEPVSQGDTYSAYGLEQVSKRLTGSTGVSAATLHSRRFQALCDTQTGSGAANLFVVGFGSGVTANLKDCVGNDSDRYFAAATPTALTNAFNSIANQIADLRLIQ